MKQDLKHLIFFLIAILTFFSCKKENAGTDTNKAPMVHAGFDHILAAPTDTVELTVIATDRDGIIVSYTWTKVSGPTPFLIVNPGSATTQVRNLADGTYEFELKATDDKGLSGSDRVYVLVNVPPGPWDY